MVTIEVSITMIITSAEVEMIIINEAVVISIVQPRYVGIRLIIAILINFLLPLQGNPQLPKFFNKNLTKTISISFPKQERSGSGGYRSGFQGNSSNNGNRNVSSGED